MKKQFVEISDEEFLANVKPEDRERVKAERQQAREKIKRLSTTHLNYGSKGPPSGTIQED